VITLSSILCIKILVVRLDADHAFADFPQLLLVLLVQGSGCWVLLGTVAIVHSALALDGVIKCTVESGLCTIERGLDNKLKKFFEANHVPAVQVTRQFSSNHTYKIIFI
jgi:hypothetical protein